MTKSYSTQPISKGGKTKYKLDATVADETGAVKVALWEDMIEKVHVSKCYHIQNCKVRIFDDCKFISTNEFTNITQLDDITNINLSTPEVRDNIIIGHCLGIDVKCTSACTCCNQTLQEAIIDEDIAICTNRNMTISAKMLKTKVVCKLLLKVEEKMVNYTTFKDAKELYLTLMLQNWPSCSSMLDHRR